uniref:Glycoprotein n=1 Tax=Rocky Ridge virus TaxID=3139880 RepID=A0AAN0N745_9VIRU
MQSVMWLLVMWVQPVFGLVGFDCTGQAVNVTAVSLSWVQRCPVVEGNHGTIVEFVQLVQERNVEAVNVKACLVERSYLLQHCGMHSHSSMTFNGLVTSEIMKIPKEACDALHLYGSLHTSGGKVLTGFAANTTTVVPVVEMGVIDAGSATCKGATFTLNGVSYTDVVMQSSYKVTLRTERAQLDVSSSKVRLSSGYSHPFQAHAGFDPELGQTYWTSEGVGVKCSPTSYIVVYEGEATVYKNREGHRTLIVNTSSQVLAVGLQDETTLCHQEATITDHPRLFLVRPIRVGGPRFYFHKSPLDPKEVDLFLYTTSKLVYVEQHLARELTSVYLHFQKQMCDVNHRLLTHLTTLAMVAPEEFAWTYTQQPGITAVLRGEVVYMVKCAPASVEYRASSSCYQEIPVTYNGTKAFLKPRSRIITTYGTEIDCSPLAPPLFFLNGNWVSFSPHPTHVLPPQVLNASFQAEWVYTSPPHLISAGLYSQSLLEKYQRQLMFPIEKTAIETTMAASMAGLGVDHQGLDASGLLRQSGLDKLQTSFMERIYGWWWTFSVNLAGVMGFIFIITAIKAVGNVVLNATFLYRTFGCGFRLFAMFWGTLAKYLLIRVPETPARDDVEAGAAVPESAPLAGPSMARNMEESVLINPPTSQCYPTVIYRPAGASAPIL